MKVLIKEHKAHIKGYGFISDLGDKTYRGIDKELVELLSRQGGTFSEEFIEDKSIPAHQFYSTFIPKGQLNIYVEFNNNLVAPPQGEHL